MSSGWEDQNFLDFRLAQTQRKRHYGFEKVTIIYNRWTAGKAFWLFSSAAIFFQPSAIKLHQVSQIWAVPRISIRYTWFYPISIIFTRYTKFHLVSRSSIRNQPIPPGFTNFNPQQWTPLDFANFQLPPYNNFCIRGQPHATNEKKLKNYLETLEVKVRLIRINRTEDDKLRGTTLREWEPHRC